MSKKILKCAIIAAVIITAGAAGYKYYKTKKTTAKKSTTTTKESRAEIGDLTVSFTGDGKSDLSTTKLSFTAQGKLKSVYVTAGQKVKKGTLLAEIDDTDLKTQATSAQGDYELAVLSYSQAQKDHSDKIVQAKNSLASLKSQLDKLYLDYYPMTQMPDAYSKVDIQKEKMDYDNAKESYDQQLTSYNSTASDTSDIKKAQLSLESSKLKLQTAEENLQNAKLYAPSDGTILSVSGAAGETVAANGDFIEMSTGTMYVTSEVAELDISKVKVGQSAEVTFDAYDGNTYTGKVTSINLIPTTDSSGLVNYTVSVKLDSVGEKIRMGMSCSIDFILAQKKNVLIIPNKAVSISNYKQVVTVKDRSGNEIVKQITAGFTDGTNVEVLSGLSEGDTVVIKSTSSTVSNTVSNTSSGQAGD